MDGRVPHDPTSLASSAPNLQFTLRLATSGISRNLRSKIIVAFIDQGHLVAFIVDELHNERGRGATKLGGDLVGKLLEGK